jgi:hypothetical protein
MDGRVIVYAVVEDAVSPRLPARRLGRGVHPPRDAESFIEEVRGDDPEVAAKLSVEERELEGVGGLN